MSPNRIAGSNRCDRGRRSPQPPTDSQRNQIPETDGASESTIGDRVRGLARAAEHWPDLVVLDLMLPGMDGLEVCRRLRAQAPVPVIMLTARGDEDDRILGLEVGADDGLPRLAARR